jgi:hypothetical protein
VHAAPTNHLPNHLSQHACICQQLDGAHLIELVKKLLPYCMHLLLLLLLDCSPTSWCFRFFWKSVLAAPATAVLRLLLCWPSGPCWTLLVLLLPCAPGMQQHSQDRCHLQVTGDRQHDHCCCRGWSRDKDLPNALLCQCAAHYH